MCKPQVPVPMQQKKVVFLVCQIRAQSRILKKWYGCSVAEQVTRIDLYNQYAFGRLDNLEGVPAEFVNCRVTCFLGHDKCEMVMVSTDVVVGKAVSLLGPFIDFNIEEQEQERAASGSATVDAFAILLQRAREKTFLPEK